MSVLAFASVKGSPGTTTAVLTMAAVVPPDRDVLVVEADPDGGSLAARFGLDPEPGLSSLAAAGRRGLAGEQIDRHTQMLGGGLPVLVAPSDAAETSRALEVAGAQLTGALATYPRDVLIDVGRLRPGSSAAVLAARAEAVVLVVRPRLDELQHLVPRLKALDAAGVRPVVLLVGERPYSPAEVAASVPAPVLGALADDPTAARVLRGDGGSMAKLRRSLLIRSAREIAPQVFGDVSAEPPSPRIAPDPPHSAEDPAPSPEVSEPLSTAPGVAS
jgi:MinD-like ATPase involved in chromosome partitioning or flagellar assembly